MLSLGVFNISLISTDDHTCFFPRHSEAVIWEPIMRFRALLNGKLISINIQVRHCEIGRSENGGNTLQKKKDLCVNINVIANIKGQWTLTNVRNKSKNEP